MIVHEHKRKSPETSLLVSGLFRLRSYRSIAPNRGTTVPRLHDQANDKCLVRSRASLPIGARLCPDCTIKCDKCVVRNQASLLIGARLCHDCTIKCDKCVVRSRASLPIGARLCLDCTIKCAKSVVRSRASFPIHSRPDGRRHRLSGPSALSSCSN